MVSMRLFNLRSFMLAAAVLGSLTAPGCYAEVAGPDAVVVGNYGYEPMYYNGYMVFYDGVGRPFHYVNGAAVWIAASSPYYAGYVAHWRAYGPAYARWYGASGHRYRTYRGPGGYYGGHHNYTRQHGRGGHVRVR
jgi:hypothetical protein